MHPKILFTVLLLVFVAFVSEEVNAKQRVLVPQTDWLVGSSSQKKQAGNTQCLLANQFDNGFFVDFLGQESGFQKLKVDFRQPVFEPGQSYDVSFVVPSDFTTNIKGRAYHKAGLEFDITNQNELTKRMRNSESLFIKLGSTVVPFSFKGFNDGVERYNQCLASNKKAVQPRSKSLVQRTEENLAAIAPSSGQQQMKSMNANKAQAQKKEIVISLPGRLQDQSQAQAHKAPQALTAQDLERQEREIWQNSSKSNTENFIEVHDQRTDAQKMLEAKYMQDQEQDTDNMVSNISDITGDQGQPLLPVQEIGTVKTASIIEYQDTSQNQAQETKNYRSSVIQRGSASAQGERVIWNTDGRARATRLGNVWQAMQGLSLKDTLLGWSNAHNVDLVWDASKDFNIKNTTRIDSSYEMAVENLLNQFSSEGIRPFAKLYNDPEIGQKVLVVKEKSQI